MLEIDIIFFQINQKLKFYIFLAVQISLIVV